ncbi:hypothetical protein HYALB_00012573 [Hymenoscyphus albidus]|uniref:Uncharacterized protein n=1 Tax=Hymenoscyphus albidus TaxID=595503 RepID=A0A9N9Q7D4_9HELO|nr:hypothetical protein HYALB_00012573 [Hymenoscyphus albidus]
MNVKSEIMVPTSSPKPILSEDRFDVVFVNPALTENPTFVTAIERASGTLRGKDSERDRLEDFALECTEEEKQTIKWIRRETQIRSLIWSASACATSYFALRRCKIQIRSLDLTLLMPVTKDIEPLPHFPQRIAWMWSIMLLWAFLDGSNMANCCLLCNS